MKKNRKIHSRICAEDDYGEEATSELIEEYGLGGENAEETVTLYWQEL